jgi:orotate phosphoribosyltransferase
VSEAVQWRIISRGTGTKKVNEIMVTHLEGKVNERGRLRDLIRERAIKMGDFVLSSGKRSSYYADLRLVTLWPEAAYLVGKLMLQELSGRDIAGVGGPAMAAIPVVSSITMVSHLEGTPLPGFMVRKEAKEHGTRKVIEGPFPKGGRVAIVEDTVTSGGSIFHAIEAVEAEGCTVDIVAAILDREEGGANAIRARGYEYRALFTVSDLGIVRSPSAG